MTRSRPHLARRRHVDLVAAEREALRPSMAPAPISWSARRTRVAWLNSATSGTGGNGIGGWSCKSISPSS
ncbi:MAG: hypothetical protein DMG00_00445 [Acidobacteria bacterium]|nr:MAG: hypothetical protein DMG00_00445 [Acidobacteriota bacterium]